MRGVDASASGYYIWPLLFGMMGGSIGIGILISRTGRYKWPITASTAVLVAGAYLMTSLSAATPDWLIWLGLFAIGQGIGPSIAGMREGHSHGQNAHSTAQGRAKTLQLAHLQCSCDPGEPVLARRP